MLGNVCPPANVIENVVYDVALASIVEMFAGHPVDLCKVVELLAGVTVTQVIPVKVAPVS